MNETSFTIYQVKPERRDYRFTPYEYLTKIGLTVDCHNYRHIYTGTLKPLHSVPKKLDTLFLQFNQTPPEDFPRHSLSVSDVVVLRCDGSAIASYVDNTGFVHVPEFLLGPFKYYAFQRPLPVHSLPKSADQPLTIERFETKRLVESGDFMTWGSLTYLKPLTPEQIKYYGLRAAPGNPNQTHLPACQMIARELAVCRWEEANTIPDALRLTEWHGQGDLSLMSRKCHVTPEQISDCYQSIQKDRGFTLAEPETPSSEHQHPTRGKTNGRNLNLER